MLQNAYSLAKIGADTAENERNLPKIWQILQLPHGSACVHGVVEPDVAAAAHGGRVDDPDAARRREANGASERGSLPAVAPC